MSISGTSNSNITSSTIESGEYFWTDGFSTTFISDATMGTLQIQTPWLESSTEIFKKRRRFLGRGDERLEAKTFFKILKKGLKKDVVRNFKDLAEKAFDEALKAEEIGAGRVKDKLEKKLEFFLKKTAIQAAGYDVYINEKMIEKYREHLPCNKELVIDEISEYEKPLPRHAQIKLKKAKQYEVFDSFWIFWIQEVKDPILFGQINEESDVYFFIDEWDNDISIEDLLKYK
jgi:hypothetical protein